MDEAALVVAAAVEAGSAAVILEAEDEVVLEEVEPAWDEVDLLVSMVLVNRMNRDFSLPDHYLFSPLRHF